MKLSYLFSIVISLIVIDSIAQNNSFFYEVELNSGVSSEKTLPFWMTANKFGKIPNSNYALTTATFGKSFSNNNSNKIDFAFKGSITGSIAEENDAIINELYASLKYKKVRLDIGSKNDEIVFEGLSSSNGNFMKSTNSRAIPGYNLSTVDFIELPFAKNWLKFKATYGDFWMNDERYVDNTLLHQKSLHFKSKINNKLDIITGVNHYAQWNGTSLSSGKQPSGFKNYIKTVTGSSGGSEASILEQINALGNHLGSYILQFDYKGTKTNWNFYISHPFEDRSGRELMNYPDNLYGFFLDLKKEKALITHALAEITYTKHRSGNAPHYTDETGYHAASGRDEYFNNFVYLSGWSYFKNVIGTPYILTNDKEYGTDLSLNRFVALHVGIKGFVKNIGYKMNIDYINFDNWYDSNENMDYNQFSTYFEINPKLDKIPFEFYLGSSIDLGNLSKNNIGGFIKIIKKGKF
ncbi:Capsule assembly protein Wzi [Lutibacter oricola]|uniref:Capsule assembly protein Wzi n=1 Tax=Lutibacter oricola TaxID=762486 RepID=A0A1H2TR42_9FLAO|nr:capsule assembly Wzi family protein [Lutibacter oricola]SDW46341.1 Capsule assembly protein Wzi [Lutibacter oricola]